MANWYGMSRSNYFKVKDEAAFRAAMEPYDVEVITDKEGRFGLLGGDEGYWPSYDNETDEDYDFTEKVSPHLADGEIAIFITVGSKKSQYGTAHAIAFDNKGDAEELNITHIYELVFEKWGVRPTVAEW